MYEYNKSRMKRKVERQAKTQAVFTGLGIIVLLFFILKFGFNIFTGVTGLFIKVNEMKSPASDSSLSTSTLLPPMLDSLPTATNSAMLHMSGRTSNVKGVVQISVNDKIVVDTPIDDKGSFNTNNVQLEEGGNIIKARLKTKDNRVSNFTQEATVFYAKKAPELEITFPKDGQSFSKGDEEITVTGKTNADNSVTVNGFLAILDNSGNFSYFLKLSDGDNTIKVETTDIAGNKTTKEVKVKFQP